MSKDWSRSERFGYEGADRAALYVKYRPQTPSVVVDRIISYLREKYDGELKLAVDVGCGSGQCSAILARQFEKVLGYDISVAQIDVAKSSPLPQNIEFSVSSSDATKAENNSVQLVNSAVAAHWFDLPGFFKETDRILCLNGVVSVFCYSPIVHFVDDKNDQLVNALRLFYKERLGPFWAAKIKIVDNEYRDIHIPYANSVRDELWIEEEMTLDAFVGYLTSWCGFQNYCKANGEAAGREILNEFIDSCRQGLGLECVPPSKIPLKIKRKYFILMGRKTVDGITQ